MSLARLGAAVVGASLILASGVSAWREVAPLALSTLPAPSGLPEPLVVTPAPPDQTLVCPGPFLTYVAQETTPRGFGTPDLDVLAANASETELVGELVLREFAGEGGETAPQPVSLGQPSAEGFLNASSQVIVESIFAWGLASQGCQQPVSEGWLVGGSATTGRQGVLAIANPGAVDATVTLEFYGVSGPISAPAARGILLEPGERRLLGLAGLAPDEASPVIRLTSQGTPVSMTLHTSLTRGLEPDGADLVGLQAPPSQTRALPGVVFESEEALTSLQGLDGYDDISPVLRLLAPESNARALITVTRPVIGDIVTEVTLEAGRVLDVSLDDLGQGNAAVVIDSDAPIVAGLRQTSIGSPRTDLAWVPSVPIIERVGSVVVPGGVNATLHLLSVSDDPAALTLAQVNADGTQALAASDIPLAPRALGTRSLGDRGGSYIVETDQPVAMAVVLEQPGRMAHISVVAPPADAEAITVYAR